MPTDSSAQPLPAPEPAPEPQPAAPAPAAAESAPRRRLKLNKSQVEEIEYLEQLVPMCRASDAATLMAERGISIAFLAAADGKISLARGTTTNAVNHSTLSEVATVGEGSAKATLMARLRQFQSAGRLMFQQTDPTQLGRYLIGERIDQSRAITEQSAQTIISNTDVDRPPSIDTSIIDLAYVERTQYVTSQAPQQNERALAKAERAGLKALIASIKSDRQQMQTAADNAWPYTNPANAGMRLKFRLPASQPYTP